MQKRRPYVVIFMFALFFALFVTSIPRAPNARANVGQWDFADYAKMESIAYVHEGFIQLVLGLHGPQSAKYADLVTLVREKGGRIVNTVVAEREIEAVVAEVPMAEAASFLDKIQATVALAYVEPNLRFKANFQPNDPYWLSQWGPAKIGAVYAWNRTLGNSSILVAVVDTGVDYNHPDLRTNYVSYGYDWVDNDADPMDDNGHGTHCAGVIAAVLNNSIGIAGLVQVRLMAEKGLDFNGNGKESDLANAIIHAVDQGAKIISMSWGGYDESTLIHDAIRYAYDHQVLLVAAAGNDATNQKMYPAAYAEVIGVTATDRDDSPAWFTNYGNWVELAAPGVDIFSTLPHSRYGYLSGTSMATPHVAGVAALIWSVSWDETRDEVRMQLRNTTDDLGTSGFDEYYGWGRINARKALNVTHNLAVKSVTLQKTVVGQGFNVSVHANVTNQGTATERFNLTISANESTIHIWNAVLAGGDSTVFAFPWNTTGFALDKYTITAYVSIVAHETATGDNVAEGGTVDVTIPGDVDGNFRVDVLDVVKITSIYASIQGQPQFSINSDVNGDGRITMSDIVVCTSHYGQRHYFS